MKTFKSMVSMLAIAALFFASACGDDDSDDGPTVDPLVGAYSLNKVTLNEEVTFMGVVYPAGSDITAVVEAALYTESPCASGPNTVIDMRANFEIYYDCLNEATAAERFGTWTITENRENLTLNLIIVGNNFPLVITNLIENAASIQGEIQNYPLVDQSVTPPTIQTVNVTIQFDREEL